MKAVTYERYGSPDVLDVREMDVPAVRDDGVLIRVFAASLNRSDWEALTARPAYVRVSGAGFRRPKNPILGSDLAGRVEAVGREVTLFRPGDEVLGDTLYHGAGAFAEYVVVSERAPLVPKPASLSFAEAAALPQGGVLALQGLRYKGQVEPGQRVLINGAGGGGGSFAVQIAKSLGAEVTGVDSGAKLELMRSIGADHAVDYTRDNYAKRGPYDRILDFVGSRSLFANRRALGPGGVYGIVGGSVPRLLQVTALGAVISRLGGKKMGLVLARPNREDLADLAGLVAAGTIKPVIDGTYELDQVPEALRRLGAGQALGKIVITP